MGENTHQNCTRQNKNKEDPGRQQPCWGFLFCTNLTQPTGALDSKTSRDILILLEKINATYGTTMLIVTHNNSIKNMVDQVVIVKDGQIRKDYYNETKVPAAELEDL